MNEIGIGLIGCGGIILQNHLPALKFCPEARVAALCDTDPATLARAQSLCPGAAGLSDAQDLLRRDDVHAVIVATPNVHHAPIVLDAVAAGKHVMCEKPLAMNHAEARQMWLAAEKANVRHMTAFTYRFSPAMRFMRHLVQEGSIGQPYHFRSCRLQDWRQRSLGWRQVARLAATGELGDMLSHRIDYAQMLAGSFAQVIAGNRQFHKNRDGDPSDLEDWVAVLADFKNGCTGVLESSKVATGRGEGPFSQDAVEMNGSEGSILFQLEQPLELQIAGLEDRALRTVPVPKEFWKWESSKRDPSEGDPLISFRYDQTAEFIDAILNQRPCRPSFDDGLRVQAVIDAIQLSIAERRWVEVAHEEGQE